MPKLVCTSASKHLNSNIESCCLHTVGNFTFTVPQYVTHVYVELYGGGGLNITSFIGGGGGYVDAILQVLPQET